MNASQKKLFSTSSVLTTRVVNANVMPNGHRHFEKCHFSAKFYSLENSSSADESQETNGSLNEPTNPPTTPNLSSSQNTTTESSPSISTSSTSKSKFSVATTAITSVSSGQQHPHYVTPASSCLSPTTTATTNSEVCTEANVSTDTTDTMDSRYSTKANLNGMYSSATDSRTSLSSVDVKSIRSTVSSQYSSSASQVSSLDTNFTPNSYKASNHNYFRMQPCFRFNDYVDSSRAYKSNLGNESSFMTNESKSNDITVIEKTLMDRTHDGNNYCDFNSLDRKSKVNRCKNYVAPSQYSGDEDECVTYNDEGNDRPTSPCSPLKFDDEPKKVDMSIINRALAKNRAKSDFKFNAPQLKRPAEEMPIMAQRCLFENNELRSLSRVNMSDTVLYDHMNSSPMTLNSYDSSLIINYHSSPNAQYEFLNRNMNRLNQYESPRASRLDLSCSNNNVSPASFSQDNESDENLLDEFINEMLPATDGPIEQEQSPKVRQMLSKIDEAQEEDDLTSQAAASSRASNAATTNQAAKRPKLVFQMTKTARLRANKFKQQQNMKSAAMTNSNSVRNHFNINKKNLVNVT